MKYSKCFHIHQEIFASDQCSCQEQLEKLGKYFVNDFREHPMQRGWKG